MLLHILLKIRKIRNITDLKNCLVELLIYLTLQKTLKVSLYICVCVYVYITHTHTHTHTRTYIYLCIYLLVDIYNICLCVCAYFSYLIFPNESR